MKQKIYYFNRKKEIILGKVRAIMLYGDTFAYNPCTVDPVQRNIQDHLTITGPCIDKIVEYIIIDDLNIEHKGSQSITYLPANEMKKIHENDNVQQAIQYWKQKYSTWLKPKPDYPVLTLHAAHAEAIVQHLKPAENRAKLKGTTTVVNFNNLNKCKYCKTYPYQTCQFPTHKPSSKSKINILDENTLQAWEKAKYKIPNTIQKHPNLFFSEEDIKSLETPQWYRGAIIDAWMHLLQVYRCLLCNYGTIFAILLLGDKLQKKMDYKGALRLITSKIKHDATTYQIHNIHTIYFPINKGGNHWVWLEWQNKPEKHYFYYFDPFGCAPKTALLKVKHTLKTHTLKHINT